MKFLLIGLALIVAVIADVSELDSATQGPNPQDIATPEPEYIDIDLPPPSPQAPQRPIAQPIQQRFSSAPIFRSAPAPAPLHNLYSAPHRPVHIPVSNHLTQHHHTAPGHSFDSNGYRYKTIRRLRYRYRY